MFNIPINFGHVTLKEFNNKFHKQKGWAEPLEQIQLTRIYLERFQGYLQTRGSFFYSLQHVLRTWICHMPLTPHRKKVANVK